MKKKLKNNKSIWVCTGVSLPILTLIFLLSCNSKNGGNGDMDGMKMEESTSSIEATHEGKGILPANVVVSNQHTIYPVRDKKEIFIQSKGIVQFDERHNNSVSTDFGGRIEKLYVRYNFQHIKKGQRIMDIYSPELMTAQENYLFLLNKTSENNLIQKAKEQLLLLNLTQDQIKQIEQSGKALYSLPIYSSYEGYILFGGGNNRAEMPANKNEQGGMSMGNNMNPKSSVSSVNEEPELREGLYVNKGQVLFTVNDFKSAWIMLSIEAKDASFVKVNDSVAIAIASSSNAVLEGKIDFIEPIVNKNEKFISVRAYINNEKQLLKNNSFVVASIKAESDTAIWIPNTAVLDLGRRKVVWLKTGIYGKGKGTFIAQEVKTAKTTENFTEVISGLSEKDEIVKEAGYMNDSETLIQ